MTVFKPLRRSLDPGAPQVEIDPSVGIAMPVSVRPFSQTLDLAAWMSGAHALIESHLYSEGAILFRGFSIGSAERFRAITGQLAGMPLAYTERSTPRTEKADGVYTSTEYASDQEIFFHNENAYAANWPGLIFFWCQMPPAAGGRTPLADCRQVLSLLPDSITEPFLRNGVMYIRRFRPGLGLRWQDAFGVSDINDLQAKYAPEGYVFDRENDGTLTACFKAPATLVHPVTSDHVWFNHVAIFHTAALPEDVQHEAMAGDVTALSAVEVRLGNGDVIPDTWIETIRAAYRKSSASFRWQKDDLLMVDNRILAHGREPFTPPRSVLVSMTDAHKHRVIGS